MGITVRKVQNDKTPLEDTLLGHASGFDWMGWDRRYLTEQSVKIKNKIRVIITLLKYFQLKNDIAVIQHRNWPFQLLISRLLSSYQ